MKVTRNKAEKWVFPCYGESNHTSAVVRFKAKNKGTCVKASEETAIGDFSKRWNMDNFTPNPKAFEDKEKFEPIIMVLETKEEADGILRAMNLRDCATLENFNKFKAILNS